MSRITTSFLVPSSYFCHLFHLATVFNISRRVSVSKLPRRQPCVNASRKRSTLTSFRPVFSQTLSALPRNIALGHKGDSYSVLMSKFYHSWCRRLVELPIGF